MVFIYRTPLTRMDRHSLLLLSNMQGVTDTVSLFQTKMAVLCQVVTQTYYPLRLIKGSLGVFYWLQAWTGLSQSSVVTVCLKFTDQPLKPCACIALSAYTRIEGHKVDENHLYLLRPQKSKEIRVLNHLQNLLQAAKKNCKEQRQTAWFARDLTCY